MTTVLSVCMTTDIAIPTVHFIANSQIIFLELRKILDLRSAIDQYNEVPCSNLTSMKGS